MPVVYRCSRCGFPLYVFARVGQSSYGLPTPSEVIYMHGGRCPRCGKELKRPTIRSIRIDVDVASRVIQLLQTARRLHAPLTGVELHLSSLISGLRGTGEAEAVA